MTPEKELLFVPLGGAGEIGMNLNLFGYGDEWVMVDLGVSFGDPSLPGIDLVMPDIEFIEARRDRLRGIVLTHAHEDHYGAVPHLWRRLQCPVYATPFTAELLRLKLAETGLQNEVPIHIVPLGGTVSVGPFEMDYITLTHSILEPNALAIRTPVGTVFHTGDWKIDPDPQIGEQTDEKTLKALGEEGVLAMICDSTNVFNAHASGSEAAVKEHLTALIAQQKGKVAVTAFASNVARIKTIVEAADACGRHAVLVGRSLHRNLGVAKAVGYLGELPNLMDERDAGYLPPEKVLYVCTGSQGESRGAMTRIAFDDHPHVHLSDGDTVIFSSKIIPGNEVTLAKLHNQLVELGVNVITEKDEFIHVSGHPGRSELTQMYQWIRPKIAVPVHGEARHLERHGDLAEELQVPEVVVPRNGDIIRLAPGTPEVIDHAPSGRLVLDGTRLVRDNSVSVIERRRALHNGHLVVSAVVNARGRPAATPGITLFGLPDPETLQPIILDAIDMAFGKLSANDRWENSRIAEAVRIAARRACREHCGKKPVTDVQILRLTDTD